nr:immunoglobulin heavy chain junction region [Mus musculus]
CARKYSLYYYAMDYW